MPDRLSLAERMDLANDPRMQDPDVRNRVFFQLDPDDQQWILKAIGEEQPMDAPGMMRSVAEWTGRYARENPAEAGGIVGGLAAAPFTGGSSALPAMAAAGLGGFGGAGLGLLASAGLDPESPAPRTSTSVLKEMGTQGAIQAGGERLGRGVRGTMQGTANAMQAQHLPKRIADDFPMTPGVLNRNWINPTTQRGAENATTLRKASAEKTRKLATTAQASGAPGIRRKDIASALKPAGRMARDEADAGLPGGAASIKRRVDDLFAAHPQGEIPLTKAQGITRVLQDEGIAAREAVQAAERPSRLPTVTADNLAQGIRQTARERIPGFEEANRTTQGLIGAERAGAELKDTRIPIRMLGAPRLTSAGGLFGATTYATGDPLLGLATGAIPLALGVPQISAPAAIALYQAGRLPYALLAKVVAPSVLREMGITGAEGQR